MIEMSRVEVFGFNAAIRGMRNPLNSWGLSDSKFGPDGSLQELGPNDLNLMQRLFKAGGSHRKYLRMIHVQMDVLAPLFWWKDYDTYKVATVANSCSTMHKIHFRPLLVDDFSCETLDEEGMAILESTLKYINKQRQIYVDSKCLDKVAWRKMIESLPSSYNQMRTIDINYETITAIIHDRRNHKLKEFRELCKFFLEHCKVLSQILDVDGVKNEPIKTKIDTHVKTYAGKTEVKPTEIPTLKFNKVLTNDEITEALKKLSDSKVCEIFAGTEMEGSVTRLNKAAKEMTNSGNVSSGLDSYNENVKKGSCCGKRASGIFIDESVANGVSMIPGHSGGAIFSIDPAKVDMHEMVANKIRKRLEKEVFDAIKNGNTCTKKGGK